MTTLTLRNPDEELAESLRAESRRRGQSINRLILEALREKFGPGGQHRRFDDLESLASTWNEEDLEEFSRATADFSKPDPRDWE